ncbi:MAG TPA: type III-A CRISPR-associated RAMP protein Csm3 [Bacteroidales bacterium]|nr:type III-A CRISPR-associated RAMP protein Csm3 [Bacteroidales bacterium]HQI45663.1 type III-A CRISPR-associated RAMP protein Csm3 [Bacteroidales bacterium]
MANKLLKKIEINGTITLKTGMHIGGTNSSMQIGGIDKGVIRNPITNQPFIPGSSLKGKMRSLLQVSKGEIKELDRPMGGNVKFVATDDKSDADLYGNATSNTKQKASRLIVRDCEMINAKEVLEKTEIPYTEGKTEVVIDRITSAASPRQIERVPAGAKFGLNLVLNIWEQDNNEKELMANLFKSLELLRDDYLGGSGSRGYGQISIDIERMMQKKSDTYYGVSEAKPDDITPNFKEQIEKLKS